MEVQWSSGNLIDKQPEGSWFDSDPGNCAATLGKLFARLALHFVNNFTLLTAT